MIEVAQGNGIVPAHIAHHLASALMIGGYSPSTDLGPDEQTTTRSGKTHG
jgi:hypothetical protein